MKQMSRLKNFGNISIGYQFMKMNGSKKAILVDLYSILHH